MELPNEYDYIKKMAELDPVKALAMAYEMGVKDGVAKQLIEDIERLK
jgi:hypothetical protein